MKAIQRTIRAYLARSAGNCNHLTEHDWLCFVGMLETGEASVDDFDSCYPGLGLQVAARKAKLDGERK